MAPAKSCLRKAFGHDHALAAGNHHLQAPFLDRGHRSPVVRGRLRDTCRLCPALERELNERLFVEQPEASPYARRKKTSATRKFLAMEFEGAPPGIILRSIDFRKYAK